MLDIVAPHQDQAALLIDLGPIDHRKPLLAGADPAHAPAARSDATHDPRGDRDQYQHHHEGDQEAGRQTQLDVEELFQILH